MKAKRQTKRRTRRNDLKEMLTNLCHGLEQHALAAETIAKVAMPDGQITVGTYPHAKAVAVLAGELSQRLEHAARSAKLILGSVA